MSLPPALAAVLAARDARPGLAAAVQALSARYRAGIDKEPALRSDLDREAYLAVRMPATAAAVGAALAAVAAPPTASHLDLGSGSGAALWAVADRLPPIARRTALERDPGAIALARTLAGDALPGTTWIAGDLRAPPELPPHDLVTLSYCLNELADRDAVIDRAWTLAARWLLIVEPGTPRGFAVIAAARRRLLAAGAHPLGPCTHAGACPLETPPPGAPGWCHQRVRLPRSRLHRSAKGGDAGWEDEPFAWLAVARTATATGGYRILAPPRVHKGAVELLVCGRDGFAALSVPRKDRDGYAAARRLGWGDRLVASETAKSTPG